MSPLSKVVPGNKVHQEVVLDAGEAPSAAVISSTRRISWACRACSLCVAALCALNGSCSKLVGIDEFSPSHSAVDRILHLGGPDLWVVHVAVHVCQLCVLGLTKAYSQTPICDTPLRLVASLVLGSGECCVPVQLAPTWHSNKLWRRRIEELMVVLPTYDSTYLWWA